ncbi:MAG TPA: hypothetical protein VFD17_07890 [Clostridia bacterium]|nr:hypothetical protein [Clostridia bacterium]
MKSSSKSFKAYLLLFIILIPILIFAIFFSNYYSIYKDLTNPSAHNPDIDVVVKNPFEGIDAIEENGDEMKENKDLPDGGPDTSDETTDNAEINSSDNTKTNPSDKTEKPSYNYIVGVYKGRFEKLQQKQQDALDSLMEEAKVEYKKNGSKKSSLFGMAPKYLGIVNNLEKQANKDVDILIDNLETELINNSYETDIVKEIKDYYNYYKKVLRAEIIKEGTKHL